MRMGVLILLGVFPLFRKKVSNIIAPKLSIIFSRLIRLGSFPECWRSANVTAIPKGASSHDGGNYRPPITENYRPPITRLKGASGVPQRSVFGPLLFIVYTCEMFQLVENKLFDYTDNSKLLEVVRKSAADRPAVASPDRGLARIQEWRNHWSMILNPNKLKL